MTELTELTPFTYQVLILLVILIAKSVISHFVVHEPLRFFQFYCLQLGKKVNKSQNSNQQQTIAGLLSVLVTWLPIAIILWLFADFVAVTYLWQALLLYIALGPTHLSQLNKSVAKALIAKQNEQAKQALKPFLLRETAQLSQVGLSKAAIEMILLRNAQQIYVVSFVFIAFGPLAALSYRLLLEMHYGWNTKLPHFKYFGFYSQIICQLVQWLPSRLLGLIFVLSSIGKNGKLAWRLSRGYIFNLNNNFLIGTFAYSLGVKLGGVAMYQQDKLRKEVFNDLARQPEPQDIINANSKIHWAIYSSVILLTLFTLLWQMSIIR